GQFAIGCAAGVLTADDHRQRGVAVEPLDDRTAVDRDEVTGAQHPGPGDAVDDLLVDGDAHDGGEPLIALEVRLGAGRDDDRLRGGVDLGGGGSGNGGGPGR